MSKKYKFFKNKITRNHPSIEISSNERTWENLEMTSSPTKKNRYIKLVENPGPNKNKNAYIRRYVRNDPIRTRGDLLERYNLSEYDLKRIEAFLKRYKNKKS